MDPFLSLIRLLRPHATLWGGLEGAGSWGVSFEQRDDLLFCWIERGMAYLVRPNAEPIVLQTNDFVLIRTVSPFALVSAPDAATEASDALVAASQDTRFRVGQRTGAEVVLHGGRFVFDTANEDLLAGLMPSLVHVPAGDTSSARIRALLQMNQGESSAPMPGQQFVVERLMELILVEVLRGTGASPQNGGTGLLAGLADPITRRALSAMHADIVHDWTVEQLARLCAVSRSGFANRFRAVMGMGPITYLLRWRIALAKDHLRTGILSVGEIAFRVGFQSTSAFSTAFSRTTGLSPTTFADRVRASDHRAAGQPR
ncbi:AraC family transcriptional regulator [Devosia sp.]|uniref:AraC family transcriptional regulator n=1 Tax=Devosia sp. TaxID=1871048 RepID=UPI003BA91C28